MLGSEAQEINDDVKDCVSELTNIIFGNAKRDLNAAGHTISAALPSVITGKGHEIRHAVQGICLVIPFSSTFGKVNVETVINTQLKI
jgi:chemotaxis protein CheX